MPAGEVFRGLENQQLLVQMFNRNPVIIEIEGAIDETTTNINHCLWDSVDVHFITLGAKSG
jgi:hypothetical protein